MRKKLVLINSCDGLYGGVESFLLNIFNSIYNDDYTVHFLTCGKSTYTMFADEIKSKGGHIDEISIYPNTLKKQIELFFEMRRYFRKEKPDIVHINSGGLSFHLLASMAAKYEGIRSVILHSHNFIPSKHKFKDYIRDFSKRVIGNILVKYGDCFLACSKGAAKWIFPDAIYNRVEIIPNGIDTKKFAYDESKRRLFRNEFGLKNELLIGNIGRFQTQKNHKFIIQIMAKVKEKNSSAKLLLAGNGELKDSIKEYVQMLGLQDNVIFLGERKDMDFFLSAIDVFILPSLHEGLPISAIEAQASGVRVILSNKITKETQITNNVIFLPIEKYDDGIWAEEITKATTRVNRIYQREVVKEAGYDVQNYCGRMKEIYSNL